MIDPNFAAFLKSAGITNVRLLPTGEYAGLHRFMFTTGLMVGLVHDEFDLYKTRYCYNGQLEARKALEAWDGQGDPPGNWIKQKPEDRMNPNYKEYTSVA